MSETDADTCRIHPFDLTKVWPHKDHPLIDVGFFELDRNPDNYFAEVEQAAFEPGNMPPGLGASPDKVLQARLLSLPRRPPLPDRHPVRALPINRPRCPVHTYHRDGQAKVRWQRRRPRSTTSPTASAVRCKTPAWARHP